MEQLSFFDAKEVDIRGLLDDGYCPCCNIMLDDLIEQCEQCGQFLSWERWKRINNVQDNDTIDTETNLDDDLEI